MTTFAPSCTRSSAMASPMPVPPTVTMATRPSKSPSRKIVRWARLLGVIEKKIQLARRACIHSRLCAMARSLADPDSAPRLAVVNGLRGVAILAVLYHHLLSRHLTPIIGVPVRTVRGYLLFD